MTHLTKKETAYFIVTAIVALVVLIGTLYIWSKTQVNCWDLYTTEEQAIINCEGG
jgi:formate hydrogenlyase subunit 3/multisubunit Na+/H+ antiporter MnhD subunit